MLTKLTASLAFIGAVNGFATQKTLSHRALGLKCSAPRSWGVRHCHTTTASVAMAMPEVGGGVKTVSETMKMFADSYQVPIVPAYRTIVTDILTTTHLARVDDRFKYDPIFALGWATIFMEFFKAYPGGDTDKIYVAMVRALDLDPDQVKADAAATLAWAEGKDEAGLEALFASPDDGPIGSAVAQIKGNKDFLYNRVFGIGMFKLFQESGMETINNDILAKWAGPELLDTRAAKFQQDYDLYSDSLQKLRAVEQLFKEIEIREKKKLAARLEEKAASAAKAAEEAKAIAEGRGPVDDTPRAEPTAEGAEAKVQESAEV